MSSTDPSIDPSLGPSQGIQSVHQIQQHHHQNPLLAAIPAYLEQQQGHVRHDLRGPLPSEFFSTIPHDALAAAAVNADQDGQLVIKSDAKRVARSKRQGPLVRKRSGWNAFYKEQFAIYHAAHPPPEKQNARERSGFSSYAAEMWKTLTPEEREVYAQRASADDALAVSRPVERLRRKRAGLLDTLGRIVAELESEFSVESIVLWSERDISQIPEANNVSVAEGEAFGVISSSTASIYTQYLLQSQLGPASFANFVHEQHQPPQLDDSLLSTSLGRKHRSEEEDAEMTFGALDPTAQQKKKAKSNISRDYHDAEFRRLLLALLNSHLQPQSQKTRLPRGFFGPYLEKHGLELIGLPERPVEIGEGGKIGGWSADALRRNLEAVRAGHVRIVRAGEGIPQQHTNETLLQQQQGGFDTQYVQELASVSEEPAQHEHTGEEAEAARILAEGQVRRGRSSGKK